jgi:hypothetical protein
MRHVVQVEETRNAYRILLGKPEIKTLLRDLGLDEVTTKCTLNSL